MKKQIVMLGCLTLASLIAGAQSIHRHNPIRWEGSCAVAGYNAAAVQQNQQAPKEVQGPKDPNVREIISNKESLFQVSKDKDNWFFTMSDTLISRRIAAVTRFTATPAGFGNYGGEQVHEQMVYFELTPDGKQLLLKSDVLIQTADTLDDISRAVRVSSSDPILAAFKLEPGAPKGFYKFNAGAIILNDNCFALPRNFRSALGVLAPTAGSYVESVHSFPINTEVRTVRTYMCQAPTTASAHIANRVTIGLNTSFVLLPETPMRPRIFDPRVGYFNDGYYEFADNQQNVEEKIFVTRWRLEPKDEDIEKMKRGELVEPKKQIVYYVDPATPKQWRPYLIAGVNDWNKAFERAGFKNAIVGKEWPENDTTMSLEDARFAVIRYLASDIPNAYGPQVHDPRSGEIIESHVGWYHNVMTLVHDWYQVQCSNVDPRARSAKYDEELMGQLIRFVSSHEIGHTLGLRHNFGASSTVPVEKLRDKNWVSEHGHTPSIMDYARFNYVAQPEDGMTDNELFPRINDYDEWAIEWAYKPCFEATDSESERHILSLMTTERLASNHRLWWGDGEGVRTDPRRQTEDLGDDPVKASEYGILNLKEEIKHVKEWNYWGNDKVDGRVSSVYSEMLGQFSRYCGHVMRYLSGTYLEIKAPYEEGAMIQPVPREKKTAILPFFDRHVFNAPRWIVDVDYIDRIVTSKEQVLNNFGVNIVNRLTTLSTLQNLNSNYPVEEYVPEITRLLFKELKSNTNPTPYRRALQRALINRWCNNFVSTRGTGNDVAAILLATLQDLQKQMKKAAQTTSDTMTRAHYTQEVDQIERALSLVSGGSASSSQPMIIVMGANSENTENDTNADDEPFTVLPLLMQVK